MELDNPGAMMALSKFYFTGKAGEIDTDYAFELLDNVCAANTHSLCLIGDTFNEDIQETQPTTNLSPLCETHSWKRLQTSEEPRKPSESDSEKKTVLAGEGRAPPAFNQLRSP